jgi:hypothetical protein
VTQGDGAAPGVDALVIVFQAQHAQHRDALGGSDAEPASVTAPPSLDEALGALLAAARERWSTPRRRVIDVHRLFYSAYMPVPAARGEDDVDENEIIVYVPPT